MEDNTKYQADNDRLTDEMFRETLSDQWIEPSSGVWKNISRKLLWKEISRFNFTNLPGLSWIGGASVVILITITAYFFIKPGDTPHSLSSLKEVRPIPIISSPTVSAPVSVLPATSAIASPAPKTSQAIFSTVPVNGTVATPVIQPSITPNTAPGISESKREEPPVTEYLEPALSETSPFAIISSHPAPDLTDGILADTLRLPIPGKDDILVLKGKIPTPNFFSASLSVLPELSFYKTTSSYSEMNYWMNLGASYHISRFSIGTGISLGYVYDEGKYRIDYRSRDSIGYYESVVGFTVNPLNPNEIIYTTELRNVYDSIQHIADDQTRNRFTYIQVPLLLGYRFVETQRLGITVQAGPAVSFLIGKKEAKPFIDYPNAKIIRIDNNTPNRFSTSWQLWLALRIDYRITKTISIFAEPTYKYTFKAFEVPGESSFSNTNSIGLGIGLQFNFGKITR